ncbi:hypothetical protein FB567DRAFT_626393 [Paraphoma chrysanthemicola]|uniref:Uncharacterized protein n=1 Tax=Paraphoma chrysanthemicola TaxID=798071 RepID=A0A8K0RAE8_9PLEO|nr:hypothetical protein FB567DRAFT_626393 [Paraphoma chrysanthemicola]
MSADDEQIPPPYPAYDIFSDFDYMTNFAKLDATREDCTESLKTMEEYPIWALHSVPTPTMTRGWSSAQDSTSTRATNFSDAKDTSDASSQVVIGLVETSSNPGLDRHRYTSHQTETLSPSDNVRPMDMPAILPQQDDPMHYMQTEPSDTELRYSSGCTTCSEEESYSPRTHEEEPLSSIELQRDQILDRLMLRVHEMFAPSSLTFRGCAISKSQGKSKDEAPPPSLSTGGKRKRKLQDRGSGHGSDNEDDINKGQKRRTNTDSDIIRPEPVVDPAGIRLIDSKVIFTDCTEHARSTESCVVTEVSPPGGFNKDQEAKLKDRKSMFQAETEEEKWKIVYLILFLDTLLGHLPSPYYDTIEDSSCEQKEDISPPSAEVSQFDAYLRRELPRKIRKKLQGVLEGRIGPIEETLKNELEVIQPFDQRGDAQAGDTSYQAQGKNNDDLLTAPSGRTYFQVSGTMASSAVDEDWLNLTTMNSDYTDALEYADCGFFSEDFWKCAQSLDTALTSGVQGKGKEKVGHADEHQLNWWK